MTPGTLSTAALIRWKPHPDDEAELRQATRAADHGRVLSELATEALLRWLEGEGDSSWQDELE